MQNKSVSNNTSSSHPTNAKKSQLTIIQWRFIECICWLTFFNIIHQQQYVAATFCNTDDVNVW